MNTSIRIAISAILMISAMPAHAQKWKDPIRFKRSVAEKHDLHLSDSALNALGIDSLLNKIENAHYTLNHINTSNSLGFDTRSLEREFPGLDSSIDIIHENVSLYTKVLDVKNLQLFDVLLTDIQSELNQWRSALFKYGKSLSGMSSQLIALHKDTVLASLMADSAFINVYHDELQELKQKWRLARDSTQSISIRINGLQGELSNEYFEALELQAQVRSMLRNAGLKSQSKEYPYLWELDASTPQSQSDRTLLKKFYDGQRKILSYYFKRNMGDQFWLLLLGVLFIAWVFRNFRVLKLSGTGDQKRFSPEYLSRVSLLPTLVILFNLTFFFNLHPPTPYVSLIEFLLVLVLSALFWKHWPRPLFRYWLGIGVLYLITSSAGTVLVPSYGFRFFLLAVNIVSVVFGWMWLKTIGKYSLRFMPMIRLVSVVFCLLNAGAAVCNILGRLSLAKILSVTSIFGLTHVIGLSVFIEVILESAQLQTIVNNIKGGLAAKITFEQAQKPLRWLLDLLSIGIWLLVFTISLNIYDRLIAIIIDFLQRPRKIGSTSFAIGNILLFIIILYVSHLLQKAVGSLYGKNSEAWDPELRKNASRLAITRLALIVIGFLIAVAASGLPLDKITILLGALGVGIGLGLQTIVNNFVSGIILIFEQPFRIGDYIELGDKKGRVLDIGIRSSKLVMDEGAEVILPNADLLSGRVVNWTTRNDNVRIELPLSIAPGHSFDEVSKVITGALAESKSVLKDARSEVLLTSVNDKSLNITVMVWIEDVHRQQYFKSILMNEIHTALAAKGVQLI